MIKKKEKKSKIYKCQICSRDIDTKSALMHVKAEEYLIGLIKKDHPRWQDGPGTCNDCITYYRKLVKDAEI